MKVLTVDPYQNIVPPSYEDDAGVDLCAATGPSIVGFRLNEKYWKTIDFIEYDTKVSIQPQPSSSETGSVCSLLFPRSSICNYNLTLANSVGVIDKGYTDSIKIRFKYVPQPADYRIHDNWIFLEPDLSRIYQRTDKIAQLILINPVALQLEEVEKLKSSERGGKGFGSSGI